jgi:hypothetical protein
LGKKCNLNNICKGHFDRGKGHFAPGKRGLLKTLYGSKYSIFNWVLKLNLPPNDLFHNLIFLM